MVYRAIELYDAEGHSALAGIPVKMHDSIIEANRAVDFKVSSNEESGYDSVELETYIDNQVNAILTACRRGKK